MNRRGILFVVSGPSGAGKGTICKALVDNNPNVFLSVSATTRKPRPHEQEGVHYYFIEEAEFMQRIKDGGMLEHAVFCGNYYGTPKHKVDQMLDAGRDVVLEIEVQGAMKVRSKYPEGVYIFVLPPSMHELKNRIMGRGTEPPEVIDERLKTAAWEYGHITKYNYILLNDSIDKAVERFRAIIKAEGCRVERNTEFIEEVLRS